MQYIMKFKLAFVAVAFAVPLFLFATTGFSSDQERSYWKPSDDRYYMPIERSHGWEIKLKLYSRRG